MGGWWLGGRWEVDGLWWGGGGWDNILFSNSDKAIKNIKYTIRNNDGNFSLWAAKKSSEA